MDVAFCIGIFMLGAATGALVSRVAILGHLRRLRNEMDCHESDRTAA